MSDSDLPGCHVCGAAPMYQWLRLANEAEAARQKVEITRLQGRALTDAEIAERYGPLRVAVTGCAEHHLAPEPDGDTDEAAAVADRAGLDARALLHGADCAGHGECVCVGA